jgi:hypothetical protein
MDFATTAKNVAAFRILEEIGSDYTLGIPAVLGFKGSITEFL